MDAVGASGDDRSDMHEREREPDPVAARRPRSEPPVAEHALLALQRRLGNQAVLRMLRGRTGVARAPAPSHLGTEPVTDLDAGGTDQDAWAAQLRGNKGVLPLYSELAKLLQASTLEDVPGTAESDINALRSLDVAALKPGLNFIARFGPRGQTGYLVGGEYTGKLPTTRDGPEAKVAILLGPGAFDPANKAAALGVLRHEMEHAFHDRLAANWLKRWRGDTQAAKQPFAAWLEKQSMSAADLALVRERIAGGDTDTEALAHLEGFIAGFPVEAPGTKEGSHRVYENELKEAAHHWLAADKAVQADFVARLKAFKGRLKGERLATLVADLKDLKARDKALAPLVDGVLP
jgi:hypothetical protein